MRNKQAINQQFGDTTSEVLADTANRTGKNYRVIYFVQDTVITSLTAGNMTGASLLAGITWKAGMQLCTTVTQIQLTSGVVIAYNPTDP